MPTLRSNLVLPALLAGAVVFLSGSSPAEVNPPPFNRLTYLEDSGWHENTSGAPAVLISFPVIVDKAGWLRLYFEEVTLSGDPLTAEGSILRMTALEDGAIMEMNARHLEQWQNSSAYFNGDTVLVEVIAQPGTGWNRIAMRAVDAGIDPIPASDKSICGATDDRQLSSDVRVARILPVGCSGYIFDDCKHCMLSSGQCTENASVVEFNVPLSDSSGNINHPSPDDQYSIDVDSMQDRYDFSAGHDWAYFGVFPNPNTGLTPAEAQGSWFTLHPPPPAFTNDIQVIGYGADTSPPEWNQVQQSHVGPMSNTSPNTISYKTDTMAGNAGSPTIWPPYGYAVGIHTHESCHYNGWNKGTSGGNSELLDVLANPQGICSGILPIGTLPWLVPPDQPVTFELELHGTPAAGSQVLIHYRFDGGSFQTVAMSPIGSDHYQGDMPAPSCGDVPEYYFGYTDDVCGVITFPGDAPAGYLSTIVGVEFVQFMDDFETDQGWTTEVLGAIAGHWERGVPVNDPNNPYDPPSDSDGSGQCFLTQNELGNSDVDAGAVRLISPDLDLANPILGVRYDYYLYQHNYTGTDRLLVEARIKGGTWQTMAVHDDYAETSWQAQFFTHDDFVSAGVIPTARTQLRFTAYDDDPPSTVEAAIDAVHVEGLECWRQIGTSYCQSGVNAATISVAGQTSVAANDVLLRATAVPPNQFGIFFYGDKQIQIPFGQGFRCVGGSTGIFRLGPPVNAGSDGVMFYPLDLTDPPLPNGLILAGSTWNFQGWFRDGVLFDLTDGSSITFTP